MESSVRGPTPEDTSNGNRRGLGGVSPELAADLSLSFLAAFGGLLVLGLLYADVSAPASRAAASAKPAVGLLEFASAEVRRRDAGSLVWEPLQAGAVLHHRDTLYVP